MKRIATAALLFALARLAQAQSCVGTSEALEAALMNAYFISQASPGANIYIRVRRSATPYVIDQLPPLSEELHLANVEIGGGYSDNLADNCTNGQRIVSAPNTTIQVTDQANTPIYAASFLLKGVTWVSKQLQIRRASDEGTLTIDSNILKGGLLVGGEDGEEKTPAHFRIVNNLVMGPLADSVSCGIDVGDWKWNESTAELANNTVANLDGFGVCLAGLNRARLDNNIIWGNQQGIRAGGVYPSNVELWNNLLQAENVIPLLIQEIGTISTDPNFQVGTMKPAPASPAVNSGNLAVPGGLPEFDVEGKPRKVGAVDRGAYESPLSNSDTFVVNIAEDTLDTTNGKLSLRTAMTLANADPGLEEITFDIPAGPDCKAQIELDPQLGPLPAIEQPVTISGYSQPGSFRNTAVSGFNANVCISLIGSPTPAGFDTWDGVAASISGIHFENFVEAIVLNGPSPSVIEGNSFGPGSTSAATGIAIRIGASGINIGGVDLGQRNYFTGIAGAAIKVQGNDSNVVGNWFESNNVGIDVSGNDNTFTKNAILESVAEGFLVSGDGNTIAKNELSGNLHGVRLGKNAFPKLNQLYLNFIANSLESGIAVEEQAFQNQIRANNLQGSGGLGIDLAPLGVVNQNDTDVGTPSDLGNRGLNFPVLLQAARLEEHPSTRAQVLGLLSSANGSYRLHFYASPSCDASGYGEGEDLVATTLVTIGNAGQATNGSVGFSIELNAPYPLVGKSLTATATSANGEAGNTSEFSQCITVADKPSGPDPDPLPDAVFTDGFEDQAGF